MRQEVSWCLRAIIYYISTICQILHITLNSLYALYIVLNFTYPYKPLGSHWVPCEIQIIDPIIISQKACEVDIRCTLGAGAGAVVGGNETTNPKPFNNFPKA